MMFIKKNNKLEKSSRFDEALKDLEEQGVFEAKRKLLTFKSPEWNAKFKKISLWHLKTLEGKTLSQILKWATTGGQSVNQYVRNRICIASKFAEFTKGISKMTWIKLKVLSSLLIEDSIEE